MPTTTTTIVSTATATVPERVDALAWDELREQLDRDGFAITGPLLDGGECRE